MAYQPKSYRKFLATGVATAMVATAVAPAVSADQHTNFTDIEDVRSWAGDAIDYLVEKGAIQGMGTPGIFNPQGNLTRGQAASLLANTLGLDVDEDATSGFDDLEGHWADAYVAAIQAELPGVIDGYTDGTYRPENNITRQEMAKITVEAFELDLNERAIFNFSDNSGWGAEYVETLASLGILGGYTDGTIRPENDITRAEAAVFVHRTEVEDVRLDVEVTEPEYSVSAVEALNATQFEVHFTDPVNESSVIANDDTLVDGVFEFVSLDGNSVNADLATGELSNDGQVLKITTQDPSGTPDIIKGRYDVTIDGVEGVDGDDFVKYEERNVDFGEDEEAPTITNVEKRNASTVRVHFSEPMSSIGNWTFVDADGDSVSVSASFTQGDEYVELTYGNLDEGTEITGTVIGARDQVDNLIDPNPSTVNFTRGEKDGVKPEVTEINTIGLNKVELTFSEEIQGLDITEVSVGGVTLDSSSSIEQDDDNELKYTLTIASADAPSTSGFYNVSLTEDFASDFSGEKLEPFSRTVYFEEDTTVPEFVSSEVIVNDSEEEVLVLTFDYDVVQPAAFTTSNNDATEVTDNLVTTEGHLTAGQFNVDSDDDTKLYVPLNTVDFDTNPLNEDATYTVEFEEGFVQGTNGVDAEEFTVEFTRTEDGTPASEAKPSVSNIEQNPANNDRVFVDFDTELDGQSATDVSNYSIQGLTIERAILRSFTGGIQRVELVLEEDTNTLTGDRRVVVEGVKAKDALVMDRHVETVSFTENVRPTVTEAVFSDTAGGDVSEITLTFSENVNAGADAFEVFIGDSDDAITSTSASVTGDNEVVITIDSSNYLSNNDISDGITVKQASGVSVTDTNGNPLRFDSITPTF